MFWAYAESAVEVWQTARAYKVGKYYEDWLDRLVVMGVIGEDDFHRENGWVFNIPKCCVEWFVHLKCTMGMEDPLLSTNNVCGDDTKQEEFWYVRCPECRIKEE